MTTPQLPQHIAIICDGNRRWAKQRNLPGFEGHRQAVNKVFEPLIDHAQEIGIKYLTFWIFSTENWQRNKKEVEGLMNLFRGFFDHKIEELNKKNVRIQMIGNLDDFAADIQDRIQKGTAETKSNHGITVTLAMSYGGRDEIIRAIKKWATEELSSIDQSQIVEKINALTEDKFAQYLDTAQMPDPELIIRTSGEQRLSGFMPWQSQYSEYYFPEFHFPEFTPQRLEEAIQVFQSRKRRFGK